LLLDAVRELTRKMERDAGWRVIAEACQLAAEKMSGHNWWMWPVEPRTR
jgi:hypothetical protein